MLLCIFRKTKFASGEFLASPAVIGVLQGLQVLTTAHCSDLFSEHFMHFDLKVSMHQLHVNGPRGKR